MKITSPRSFAFALIACALSLPATAMPIHATFDGAVTGGLGFYTDVLSAFPIGTSASFDVTFDDAALSPSAPLTEYDLAPVSGTVRLGALEWTLDGGQIWTYSYSSDPGFPIIDYGLHLTGTGPLIATNDSLFGLFLHISPSLIPAETDPFMVGFRSPFVGGESYGYAVVNGTSTITRENAVPEPTTMALGAFAFLIFWARRKAKDVVINARSISRA